jgi:hypothetical protein
MHLGWQNLQQVMYYKLCCMLSLPKGYEWRLCEREKLNLCEYLDA